MRSVVLGILFGTFLNLNYGFSAECSVLLPKRMLTDVVASNEAHLAADFNQDGSDDLLFLKPVMSFKDGYKVADYLNYYASDLSQYSVAAGDLNGDRRPDIVRSVYWQNGGKNIEILLNGVDGSFSHPRDTSKGLYSNGSTGIIYGHGLALADVNSDGILDIVSTTRTQVSVMLGTGDGAFAKPILSTVALPTTEHTLVIDLDGDLRPDLVTVASRLKKDGRGRSHGRTDLYVYLGLGDGRFDLTQKFTLDAHVSTVNVGKINRLGDLGLIISGQRGKISGRGGIYVLKFNVATKMLEEIYNDNDEILNRGVLHAAVADFNDDGVLDIALLKKNMIFLKINNGEGNLSESHQSDNPTYKAFANGDILTGNFTSLSAQLAVYGNNSLQFFGVNKSCFTKRD